MSISDKSDSVRDDAMKAFFLGAEVSLGLAAVAMKRLGEVVNQFAQTLENLSQSMDQEIPPPPEPPQGATGPYPPPLNDHGVAPGVPTS